MYVCVCEKCRAGRGEESDGERMDVRKENKEGGQKKSCGGAGGMQCLGDGGHVPGRLVVPSNQT